MSIGIASLETSESVNVTNAFDAANHGFIDVDFGFASQFSVKLSGLWVSCESISAGALKTITMRICTDDQGQNIVIPDTDGDISKGLTDSTKGFAVYKIDLNIALDVEKLYFFFKCNTGTTTVAKIKLTYERAL